ncbi:hypothetical protein Plim_3137 [Planctopirus limnophila DSM 3776]|uniref:Uncharacterized protein n=1 Tax=Planctopirus limnophila (strain ATCC 43296 / DSM 3776 / IFAM 1008 / Mu 290) TaxID=521674 RepID=D5ST01_PLAL2|nr:hypothetical protein [Planctopirus limnophila]ADG68952.1 hypothetical protein Plim_3137 [Planctopirus limnophila DSM 3776]
MPISRGSSWFFGHLARLYQHVAISPHAGEAWSSDPLVNQSLISKGLESHPAQPVVQRLIQSVKNRDKQQNHFYRYNHYNQTCITLANSS